MSGKVLLIIALVLPLQLLAQKYSVTSGEVTFFSDAAIEDIRAINKKVQGLFNIANNEFAFVVPIRAFEFEKKLMQEHFNEKYMESEKYPKATFQGIINGITLSTSGAQQVTAKGKLTIHGVTKEVVIMGTCENKTDGLVLQSKFIVALKDYDVTIPQLLWQNIAEQVEVTVSLFLNPIQNK